MRAQKYYLLEDDEALQQQSSSSKSSSKGKQKDGLSTQGKRERHIRKRDEAGDWESDEEDISRKRRRAGSETVEQESQGMGEEAELVEDDPGRDERERVRDLEERDKFAERMRERDKDRTKKVIEDRSTKGAAVEAAQRRQLADDATARVVALPSLRERSRQDYLSKRELQQIELLRREIADDDALFQGMKISKRERRMLEHKKEVLKLAEERMRIDDKYDGYQLPEDYITEQGKIDKKKKESVLYQRYEEAKAKDDQFVTDVDQWEASQTRHSTFKSGALDKKEIIDNYDYVFDESQTIQFVMGNTMNQDPRDVLSPADRLLQAQIEEAERKG